MADPIFGSKCGPQNGVQNWITFSFLLLGLCLGPFLGSRFGPKSGASHRKILLLPADVLQADLRRTIMSVSVNTCFFSLCVPICFLYSRGPFMAAVFLLVFWILFSGPWWSRLVAKHSSLWLLNVLLAFVWGCWISWLLSAWTDCFGCLHLVQVAVCFGQMSLTHFLDLGWWVGA